MKLKKPDAGAFAHVFFLVVLVLGLYFIINSAVNLTGYAVLDETTVKSGLEAVLGESALFGKVTNGNICIIINDETSPVTLNAQKGIDGWAVTEATDFCGGQDYQDLVVQFKDYDSFSKLIDDPSPRNIAVAAENQDFEILSSRIVETGGNVICDASFRMKYCGAVKDMGDNSKLIEADLSCCLDALSSEEKAELESHLLEGQFRDEEAVPESPSSGMSMTVIGGLAGGVVLLIIVISVFLMKGKKPAVAGKTTLNPAPMQMPQTMQQSVQQAVQQAMGENPQVTELRNYCVQAMSEGYTPVDLKQHLLEIGWDDQTADKVINEAYSKLR